MEINEYVGHNIKKWREMKEMKQDFLAKRLNITAAALSHIENGKTDISINRIAQIANVLEIDFSILLMSPKQMITLYTSQNVDIGVNNLEHNQTYKDLLIALQAELNIKNEQILFLQNRFKKE